MKKGLQKRRMSRREMLSHCSNGFGGLALLALAGADPKQVCAIDFSKKGNPAAPKSPHFSPKARSVIMLYMDGGPSQVDSFDPKPRLKSEHGKPFGMKMEPTQFNNNGNTFGGHWDFHRHGQSGIEISDLFPHIAKRADDLCVIRSMVSEFSEHTGGNYFLHTGLGLSGRPSAGAWVAYGLGSENSNLPGFVVINGGLTPPGGLDNFSNGFLPATFQGSIFRPSNPPLANLKPDERSRQSQQNKLRLLDVLDRKAVDHFGGSSAVEAAISNYELAFRMQAAVPELMAWENESSETRRQYGLDSSFEPTQIFGKECLLARRLIERGVRFVELTCPNVGADRWDQHSGLKKGHSNNALAVDQPIGALLTDLKERGLLDETLVIWCGEFGRTPFSQGKDGRDHNPFGFSIWLAGGGIKGGMTYGSTDEYGYKAIENRMEIYDLHATMLHLLGLDHTRLTVRFSGRDMRLTDVHGKVIKEIIA